ncbi:MAG TPA: hypothetical protein VMZ91_05970 [Candidatus Paceibacterota bacterium]|nr:hypothetical protein [Candidatus Paceibacterota bacterium]
MLNKNMSKQEIEEELSEKGDFVQIDYLTNFLKKEHHLGFSLRKFLYSKLAEIYERRNMLVDSAKMFDKLGLISIAFSEKIKNYVKETKLYIKAGFFDWADGAMKKALNQANEMEKQDIYFAIKDFYKRQAEVYEKERRRNHALRIYEKLLELNVSDFEKQEIKKKILELYEKLGKLKEYFILKKEITRNYNIF